MKKCLLSILLIVAIIASTFSVGLIFTSKNDYITEYTKLVAKYDDNLTEEQKRQPYGYSRIMVSDYDGNNYYGACDVAVDKDNNFVVLQYNSPREAEIACDRMINDGLIAEPDGVAQLADYDVGEMCLWASEMTGVPNYISNYNMDCEDVIVAVVDTGVMLNHPELQGRFYNDGYNFSGDEYENADYVSYYSVVGSIHSTFICGVIANNTPDNVKILPYKVVPYEKDVTSVSSIVSAVNDAVSKGADVINLSFEGTSGANSYKIAIANAVKNGVNVCVCAGNDNIDIESTYPASVVDAITVSSVDQNKAFSDFSNYGENIDYSAPGTSIYSCIPDSNNNSNYATASGTSFATPFVTAAIANIKSIDTTLSQDEICNILSTFSEDLGDKGRDVYYGNGLIDIGNMVYTDNETYSFSIPQGTLDVYKSVDYTADTQPWSVFAGKLKSVTVSEEVTQIGDYAFYNMSNATFDMADTYNNIGNFAFYGCTQLKEYTFDIDVENIGVGTFGGISENFVINGYRNTAAETYCAAEDITFNAIGCNHNYTVDIVDPTDNSDGYLVYTCAVCGHTYNDDYIEPTIVDSGICGENLTYQFDNYGRLKITGAGSMYDFIDNCAPWLDYAKNINKIIIDENVTGVNAFAFYNCTNMVKFDSLSSRYTVVDGSLYSADLTELVCYAGGNTATDYEMPDTVNTVNASAFICANKINTILPNDNFVFDDNVLYDKNGDIIIFMPSFAKNELVFNTAKTIKQNAMILCDSVTKITVEHPNVVFEPYSVGYFYNGTMQKQNLAIYGCYQALVEDYATQNGFEYQSMNSGLCGDTMFWQYDTVKNILTITGDGEMFNYTDAGQVPWSSYLSTVRTVVIDEEVTALSDYAFYNAKNLRTLTMPLSISAPQNDTVWYGCSNITTIHLVYGTGVMDDYGSVYTDTIYKYTPWYLSRNKITSLNLDENVKYIGNFAFRGCTAIKSITLKECEQIGEYAFIACSNLTSFTNYSANTVIPDYALFSYKGSSFGISTGRTLYGVCESTSRDYCEKFGITFSPINCHHYVKGTISNVSGKSIADAKVYLNDVLVAVTNGNGQFIACDVLCGDYTYKIEYNGIVVSFGEVTVDTNYLSADINVVVGDYYSDGIINTKDYVYAYKSGYNTDNIDLGEQFKVDTASFAEYENQLIPCLSDFTVVKSTTSNLCTFTAYKSFDCEFTVTECGFIYGKNMPDDYLYLDMVGQKNSVGYYVKSAVSAVYNQGSSLGIGSADGTGKVSARFYAKYTNGVNEYIYYSDVCSYNYDEV